MKIIFREDISERMLIELLAKMSYFYRIDQSLCITNPRQKEYFPRRDGLQGNE